MENYLDLNTPSIKVNHMAEVETAVYLNVKTHMWGAELGNNNLLALSSYFPHQYQHHHAHSYSSEPSAGDLKLLLMSNRMS